jgi:hypothetical protein
LPPPFPVPPPTVGLAVGGGGVLGGGELGGGELGGGLLGGWLVGGWLGVFDGLGDRLGAGSAVCAGVGSGVNVGRGAWSFWVAETFAGGGKSKVGASSSVSRIVAVQVRVG